jgi:hypothetical protein
MRQDTATPYPYPSRPARRTRPDETPKSLPAPDPAEDAAAGKAANPFVAMLAPLKRRRLAAARDAATRGWAARK